MSIPIPVSAFFALCVLLPVAAHPVQDAVATTSVRPWLSEADFALDASLHATRRQTVVLELESSGPGEPAIRRNSVRFLIEKEQKYSFCIPEDEPYILRIKLKRSGGPTLVNGRRGDHCDAVLLEPGSYRLDIFHDGRMVPQEGKKAFLYRPQRRRHRRSQSPAGTSHGGTLQEQLVYPNFFALSGGSNDIGKMYPHTKGLGNTINLSASSNGVLDGFVWSFYDTSTDFAYTTNSRPMYVWAPATDWNSRPYALSFTPLVNGSEEFAPYPIYMQDTRNCPTPVVDGSIVYYCLPGFILNDQGDGVYTMWADVMVDVLVPWVERQPGSSGNEIPIMISDISGQDPNSDGITWDFTFIGYPDASTMPELQEGEFALYGECNFQSTAFVFDGDATLDEFSAMTQPEITPPVDHIRSINLGPSTFVELFKDGQRLASFGGKVSCLSDAIQADSVVANVAGNLDQLIERNLVARDDGPATGAAGD